MAELSPATKTEQSAHPTDTQQKKEKPKKSMQREILEWVLTFLIAIGLALVIRTYVFEPVRVEGNSMLNTLENGEFMIASKWDYLWGDPQRFDVVICKYPDRKEVFVKRIIGLPGDTVAIRGDELYINGEHIAQPFSKTPDGKDYPSAAYPWSNVVPEGCYFVMGDNRDHSNDSRYVGPLQRSMIRGHVRCVVFPFNKIRTVPEISTSIEP